MKNDYYSVSLTNDNDGTIWQLLVNQVINQCNLFEYTDLKKINLNNQVVPKAISPIGRMEQYEVELLSFWGEIESYSITQRLETGQSFEWFFVKTLLFPVVKEQVLSIQKISDYCFSDSEHKYYNPTLYKDDTVLLWADCSINKVFILLSEEEKQTIIKKGVKLNL